MELPTWVATFLAKQGWPGVIIAVLLAVIVVLWKDRKSLQDKIDALQEKRIAEGKELLATMNTSTGAIQSLTQVVGLITRRD